jgi:hypothetical protein
MWQRGQMDPSSGASLVTSTASTLPQDGREVDSLVAVVRLLIGSGSCSGAPDGAGSSTVASPTSSTGICAAACRSFNPVVESAVPLANPGVSRLSPEVAKPAIKTKKPPMRRITATTVTGGFPRPVTLWIKRTTTPTQTARRAYHVTSVTDTRQRKQPSCVAHTSKKLIPYLRRIVQRLHDRRPANSEVQIARHVRPRDSL